jgi:hypothetical protein
MAREFARIHTAIWNDDDFRALSWRAQHLYFVLDTDPELSYAGVTDWRPGRIAARAADWSIGDLYFAAQELAYAYFIVIDQDTEEVLVRSFLRHDGLLKQPRMAVSVTKSFGSIGSNKIRGVIVHELRRLRKSDEYADVAAWSDQRMKDVLKQRAINAKEDLDLDLDIPEGVVLPLDLPIGLGQR